MHSLNLYIPGLLKPSLNLDQEDIPDLTALNKILSCSRREKLVNFGFSDALCMLFNLRQSSDKDFPVAAITRLVDDKDNIDGIWMRADPIYLAADHNSLILFDESYLDLDQHDALVFAAEVRNILDTCNIKLEVPQINRWYIQLEKEPGIKSIPIHEVYGQEISGFLPTGSDRLLWNGITNEIQMALHQCPLNDQRIQKGEKPMNSVWFWGAGTLPQSTNVNWSQAYSDEEITRGFSTLAGIPCHDLPEGLDAVVDQSNSNDDVLVVISFGLRHQQYGDIKGWQDFVSYLEECWFGNLINALKYDEIEEVTLLTEYQQFTLSKKSLLAFWRKRKPLSFYVDY